MSFLDEYGWIIIFGIIILFTILTMLYYSKKDIYDPEPHGRLILGFILGVISVIPALILSIIGILLAGNNVFIVTVVIAPITEEIAKLWFVIYLARSDTFDGPLDGLIYGAMVGAGFAAAENLIYGFAAVSQSGSILDGITLTTFRSLTQIIGHPLYTGLAGVGVGEWKVGLQEGKYGRIWRSMLFHGLWNFSASIPSTVVSFTGLGIVIIVNIIILRRELKRTLELDQDAYDRGYYDQKQKRMEMKRTGMAPHGHNSNSTITTSTLRGNFQKQSVPSGIGGNTVQPNLQKANSSPPSSNNLSSTKICTTCGNEGNIAATFCKICGTPYPIKQTVTESKTIPTKTCGTCGNEGRMEALFCKICGTAYPITKPISTDNQSEIETLPNFCKTCGNKRQEGDRFCRICGNQIVN